MQISIHLSFPGQCREAFKFYAETLNGSFDLFTYGDTPMAEQVPEAWHDKAVHATLVVNDTEIAGADVLPDHYKRPEGFSILLEVNDPSEVRRIFDIFSKDGNVKLPLQETFWSPCYGLLEDKFGVPWEIYCEA